MSPLTAGTNVSTIRPPSLSEIAVKKDASDDSDNSSENSVTAPPAVQKVRSKQQESSSPTKEIETTYALHRVLSSKNKAEQTVDAAAVNALPSFPKQTTAKKLLPSALRKVKSVGPGVKNVTVNDPYEMKHTVSKTRFMESGEVEVEAVDEERSPTEASRAW